jgi:hypothetical protein
MISRVRKECMKFDLSLMQSSVYISRIQAQNNFAQKLLLQTQTQNLINFFSGFRYEPCKLARLLLMR